MTFSSIEEVKRIESENNLSVWMIEDYQSELPRKDSIALIAIFEEKIIGFIVARLIMQEDFDIDSGEDLNNSNEAEIYNIAVKKDFQKIGVGQSLMEAFLCLVKKQTALKVWLEVRESNRLAFDFYQKNGFTEAYRRKNFYHSPVEDVLVMRLDLSDKK
ncbi:MAG TPA: GNAT family N-acetyltransferase [Pyrinomonadaceae bacterium]|jgi:ribosomal-protein-alanine N-acetyltransferase